MLTATCGALNLVCLSVVYIYKEDIDKYFHKKKFSSNVTENTQKVPERKQKTVLNSQGLY